MNSEATPQRNRRRRLRTVLFLFLAGVMATGLLSACNELPAEPIDIHNQSDEAVTVMGVDDTGDFLIERVAPGEHSIREGCIDPDLEIRLDNGNVVAQRQGPFCEGDPTWVITQAEVDAASAAT